MTVEPRVLVCHAISHPKSCLDVRPAASRGEAIAPPHGQQLTAMPLVGPSSFGIYLEIF
jgi:hypothetical protein